MRRVPVLVAVAALGLAATGCSGNATTTPTVASVDFTPTAELHVADAGQLVFALHEVTTTATVPAGSVLLVTNDGHADHRIRAGTTFDTGTLHPGDQTTVVLADAGDLTLVDVPTGRDINLTVTPRA